MLRLSREAERQQEKAGAWWWQSGIISVGPHLLACGDKMRPSAPLLSDRTCTHLETIIHGFKPASSPNGHKVVVVVLFLHDDLSSIARQSSLVTSFWNMHPLTDLALLEPH